VARRRRRHYRSRSRNRSGRIWITGSIFTVAGIWAYAHFISPVLEEPAQPVAAASAAKVDTAVAGAQEPPAAPPRLVSKRPETTSAQVKERVSEKGANEKRPATIAANPESAERSAKLLASGKQALAREELVAARAYLSEAVNLGLGESDLTEARAALVRIGAQTIFSPNILTDDPLVRTHVVSPGESLGKIASKYDVTAELLAVINGIADKNMIRAGQSLKVVQGPFHVRVHKATFRMDVYLQDTFVRQYQVGLGANDSTPTGEWIVGTKLTNPTYYPPRSGRIVAADDPQNPLGEHWIELIGVAGNARGQERYGIHGTIAPDSIGRSESLGCIRMHNEDVAEVFTLLVPKKSRVLVR